MESYPARLRPRGGSNGTVARILDAAQQVLIAHGYAGFTMRLVARSGGISPGNLTYHFPSKNELLRAVITRILEGYSRQFDKILSDPDVPDGQELERLVHWLLMDSTTEETVRVSREIWAMALHDSVIRKAADDFYDELLERLVTLLQRSRPNTDRASIREMVHFLALLSEGTAVLYGTRRERTVRIERIIELAAELLRSLESNSNS